LDSLTAKLSHTASPSISQAATALIRLPRSDGYEMYGKGFELVMPDRSKALAEVQKYITNPKVTFKVCAIALKNNNIDKSQLLPGVQTVPDGIHELVSRQQEHWGYIKVSVSR
jgi:hypothetical protein